MINSFLDTLMKPICFVAHNGNKFDYPIFLWELKCLDKVCFFFDTYLFYYLSTLKENNFIYNSMYCLYIYAWK